MKICVHRINAGLFAPKEYTPHIIMGKIYVLQWGEINTRSPRQGTNLMNLGCVAKLLNCWFELEPVPIQS